MRSHIVGLSVLRWGVLGVTMAILAGVAGPAARGATLRWKFKPGETLHYVMEQKSVATGKFPGGQEMKTMLSQTIDVTWTVKSVDPSGLADLTQTITRIRDRVEGTVGSYSYDSKDAKEPESLLAITKIPVFKALLGVAVPFKLSARGEPGGIRVPDVLTKALTELGPAAAGAAALLSEEGLKEVIGRTSLILPEEDVVEGKSWTQQTRSASPVGTFVLDSTYTYEKREPDTRPDVVKIAVEIKAGIQPAVGQTDPAKIRSQKSQGTFRFDNAAGHIVDSSLNEFIEVAASVKVGSGGLTREMEIVQTNESTTTRKLVKAD